MTTACGEVQTLLGIHARDYGLGVIGGRVYDLPVTIVETQRINTNANS